MQLTNEVTQNLVKYLAQKCPEDFYVNLSYYGGTEYPRAFVFKVQDKKIGYFTEKQLKAAAQELLNTVLASLEKIERGEFEEEHESVFAGTGNDSDSITVHELSFYLNDEKFWFFFGKYSEETDNEKGYIRQKEKAVDFITMIEG
jgi:hypothetical protein